MLWPGVCLSVTSSCSIETVIELIFDTEAITRAREVGHL